jgi:spoIIIJ-associated protein
MSEYQEFTGKSVEEALRNAREAFGVGGLDDLDFEILTPGSRGVLGMGAEPARIVAAPRSALGGAAPRREAAAQAPLPAPPPREPREDRPREPRGRDRGDRGGDRGFGGRDRGPRPSDGDRPREDRPREDRAAAEPDLRQEPRPDRVGRDQREPRADRGGRDREAGPAERRGRGDGEGRGRPPEQGRGTSLTEDEQAQVTAARPAPAVEREEIQAVQASPEALEAGRDILETLMRHMGYSAVTVEVITGETSKLDVRGSDADRESLGALIGRKGERLSALQHLVNLMLSRRMGDWTRVLVDVEDYRGRRERQLQELAQRAAERVQETGKMLQLEPMPALERRWIHLALRAHPGVATQSIGEEPNRRVVVLRREA